MFLCKLWICNDEGKTLGLKPSDGSLWNLHHCRITTTVFWFFFKQMSDWRLYSDTSSHEKSIRVLNFHFETVMHAAVADLTIDRRLLLKSGLNKRGPWARKTSLPQTKKKKEEIHNLFSSLRKSMVQLPLRLLSNSGAVSFSLTPLPEKRFYIRRLFERNKVRTTQWGGLCICFLLRVKDKRRKVSFNIFNVFWPESKKTDLGVRTMQNIIWRLWMEM